MVDRIGDISRFVFVKIFGCEENYWVSLISFLTLFSFLRHFPMALDLGCGRGHISKFLTKVGTDSVQVFLTKVINPLLPNISMHILHTVL